MGRLATFLLGSLLIAAPALAQPAQPSPEGMQAQPSAEEMQAQHLIETGRLLLALGQARAQIIQLRKELAAAAKPADKPAK